MEAINYANGGANMTLPADTQLVQGISGNAVYLPAGAGSIPIEGNRNEMTLAVWRQWDGVAEADNYRGVFETANIKAYFDQATDLLTIVLAEAKTVTDIKDDQEQSHWCFCFAKNGFFKIYKNAELKAEITAGNYPVDFSEGVKIGGGRTHATFDEFRLYKKVLNNNEINGLYRLVTKGTQVQQLEHIIASTVPKYLGVVETVPSTRTSVITKGQKLGAVDANPGDWVLSGRTIGGWKVGVCYRWTGAQWLNLEPEYNYANEYHACLLHLMDIEELKEKTGHFGALFAKVLIAQKAMIDELVSSQAFIKNLVVQKLHIDSIPNDNTDFELKINRDVGILAINKEKTIFSVSPTGNAVFSGDIITPPFELKQGAIKSYKLSYTNAFLAEILRGSKFEKSNAIPFLGEFSCSGTFQGKAIKGLSVYVEKNSGSKAYYNKIAKTDHKKGQWGLYQIYYMGNVFYKTTKYTLKVLFKDNSNTLTTEELIEPDTRSVQITSDYSVAESQVYRFEAPYSETIPSVRVEDLIINVNSNATTMRLKNIPLGPGDYEPGTIYDADGFLKIKR